MESNSAQLHEASVKVDEKVVLQEVAGTDLTPAIKTSKPKTQRRKRTLSDGLNIAEYGRVHVDGKSGGSGRRERSGTVTSATMEPMLMYPVYDSGIGATPLGKIHMKEKDSPRSPRMQCAQTCQRIMNHLLCDGASSLDDLSTVIPEVSRENLMAILEVLDVLGVVMCFTCKQPPIIAGASSKSGNRDSSDGAGELQERPKNTPVTVGATPKIPLLSQTLAHRHTNDMYYAIVGFGKGTESTQFSNLKEQLKTKRGNIHKIHARVQALDELTRAKQPHTRVERLQAFKRVVEEFSSSVKDDPLYSELLAQPDLKLTGKR